MKSWLLISFLLSLFTMQAQVYQLVDGDSNEPLAFATISFNDGRGTFADDDGKFQFSRKRYPGIDSLTISSLGYKTISIATADLVPVLKLYPDTDELDAVVVRAKLDGKFKEKEIDAIEHDDYFNSWLPTVESEIAVKFERSASQPTQIKSILLPVIVEEQSGRRKGKVRKFSTLFRLQFYAVNVDGSPTDKSNYPDHTFIINQETEDVYNVDVEEYGIQIPKNGLFASIQVLGYTYPDGKLIDAKKYREIKTRTGFEKVSTTYRPLLPFTDEVDAPLTWVRRIFFNNKTWQKFDLSYNPNSKLVRSGHDSYGMGAVLKVYKQD
ncbi:carboxypeptidase-like regulatory domain-containing protein [Nonlabens ponticola]|uniref:Carboxypeptidase-like regulatory domain-containing protein n=1 Tax=Nonlabens ponticola TaxID=2496866 RepID=A0A3S9MUV9_9FLAO|nr:carboxypeptidase-like regulatory domain-containing protein [Nonlabens ponticola]AZQ42961.1 carboxypeptidase-like regulatory domain-containing protein [Nonlabens ponticola]